MSKKLTHFDFVKLGEVLGYEGLEEGLCHGYALMLSQAWLAEDEQNFFKRHYFIENYNKNFEQLLSDIDNVRQQVQKKTVDMHDERTQQLLEINAFYDGIELYFQPNNHSDLFANAGIYQGNIETIYSVVRSIQSKDAQEEVSVILRKPYAFNKDDLRQYLKDLEQCLNQTDIRAPILLSSATHTICLLYHRETQSWSYSDINEFKYYPQLESYTRELKNEELVDSIFNSFFCWFNSPTVFNTMIITKSSQKKLLTEALVAFDHQYPIKPEHALMYDSQLVGLFYIACQTGHTEVVRMLLQQTGILVGQPNNRGITPLYIACYGGHTEIVTLLLQRQGINVNQACADGLTPLFVACQHEHTDIVALLLQQKDIQINQAKENGATPLFIACYNGNTELVALLLQQKNIQMNQARKDGATPLFIACYNGHTQVVKLLLQQEEIREYHTNAPLLYSACQRGHTAIVSLLIDSKYIDSIDSIGQANYTPLLIACRSLQQTQGKKELFELLLKHQASLTHKNDKGQTALDIAVEQNNKTAIEAILKHLSDKILDAIASQETLKHLKQTGLLNLRHKNRSQAPSNSTDIYKSEAELPRSFTFFSDQDQTNKPNKIKKTDEELNPNIAIQTKTEL